MSRPATRCVDMAALWHFHANPTGEENSMLKRVFTLAFLCTGFWSSVAIFASAPETCFDDQPASAAQPVNPVIEWNRTLLAIVRTPGAQPATIHSTRNFAMLHAAIFDAVNNIDRDFEPYAVRHPHVSRKASA